MSDVRAKLVTTKSGQRLALLGNGRVARLPPTTLVPSPTKTNPGALGSTLLLVGAGAVGALGLYAGLRYVPNVANTVGLGTVSAGASGAPSFNPGPTKGAMDTAMSAFSGTIEYSTPTNLVVANAGHAVYDSNQVGVGAGQLTEAASYVLIPQIGAQYGGPQAYITIQVDSNGDWEWMLFNASGSTITVTVGPWNSMTVGAGGTAYIVAPPRVGQP